MKAGMISFLQCRVLKSGGMIIFNGGTISVDQMKPIMNFYQTEIGRIKNICYSNDKQIKTVIAARTFINNNFEKDLRLDLLSHLLFTSKFHLLRLFKKYYGLTPKQYLTIKRLEESKKYLKKGMPVSDTCYQVGFETPSSFSTLFRSKTGLSPIEFQKKQFSQSRSKPDSGTCETNLKG